MTNNLIEGWLRSKKWSSQMTMQCKTRNIVSDQTQISLLKFNSIPNESGEIQFHNKSRRNFKRKFWWKMGVKVKFAVGKWQLWFLGLFKIPAPQGQSWPGRRNPWLSPDTNRGSHPKPSFYTTFPWLSMPYITELYSLKGFKVFDSKNNNFPIFFRPHPTADQKLIPHPWSFV